MVKPVPPMTETGFVSTDSMTASGGEHSSRRVRKSSMSLPSPSTSIIAPDVSFRTEPESPRATAVV